MISPPLSRRLARAFTRAGADLSLEERARIARAAETAETWDRLPPEIRSRIEKVETSPR